MHWGARAVAAHQTSLAAVRDAVVRGVQSTIDSRAFHGQGWEEVRLLSLPQQPVPEGEEHTYGGHRNAVPCAPEASEGRP